MTGTGLAPFRGFIQERNMSREEGKTVGDTILYFGCRKKSEDYIYKEVCSLFHPTFISHVINRSNLTGIGRVRKERYPYTKTGIFTRPRKESLRYTFA